MKIMYSRKLTLLRTRNRRWKTREEKAIALAIIGVILLATLATLPVFVVATDDISTTYFFDASEILSCLDTGEPTENLRVRNLTGGNPWVPYKIAHILLPPYTEVANVSVQATVGGQHAVNYFWRMPQPYPEPIYKVGSVNSFRGYNIISVYLHPAQYQPTSNLTTYYTEMTVQVTLTAGDTMDTFRSLEGDREIAEKIVDNPWTLTTYDSISPTNETLGTYEYLIITNTSLSDEFQFLADWKAKWVNSAKVVTVNDTASDQEVKEIINYYYAHYGTSYVLLGGDVEVIPHHNTRVDHYGQSDSITDDYWFADFDEDHDNVSYYEVYIGRAPVDNEEETTHFVNKVILFEQMDKPKANLFHTTWEFDEGRKLANRSMQYVPSDYVNYTLFEEIGDPISTGEYKNFWRNDGIMCVHNGHGSNSSYQISYGGNNWWSTADICSMDNTFWPVHTSIACWVGQFDSSDCLAENYVKADNGAIACFMNDNEGLPGVSDEFVEMQFKALYQDGYQNTGAILAHSKHHLIDEATDPYFGDYQHFELCWRQINLIGDPETPVLTKRSLNLNLTVLAEDQNSTSLATGYVYIDGQYRGRTNSTYIVSPGHKILVTDFWESGNTGWRYFFRNWTDCSEDNPRIIAFVEDTTITAYFYKLKCPGDVDGIVQEDGNLTVDGGDITIVQNAYWIVPGDPNWDSRADVSGDEYVIGEDMIIVCNNLWEEYYPPP